MDKPNLETLQDLSDHKDVLPAVISFLEYCTTRHVKAIKTQSIDSPEGERKLLILRARYDGMLQLIQDFQAQYKAATK